MVMAKLYSLATALNDNNMDIYLRLCTYMEN